MSTICKIHELPVKLVNRFIDCKLSNNKTKTKNDVLVHTHMTRRSSSRPALCFQRGTVRQGFEMKTT